MLRMTRGRSSSLCFDQSVHRRCSGDTCGTCQFQNDRLLDPPLVRAISILSSGPRLLLWGLTLIVRSRSEWQMSDGDK